MSFNIKLLPSLISLLFLFTVETSDAMKLALPEKFEFQSADKQYKYVHVPHKDPYVTGPKKVKWIWKGVDVDYPSEVLVAPEAKRVYVLGGYGDPGVLLGKVTVYDIETGKVLQSIDLNNTFMALESMSRTYGESTNFPWITWARLMGDGSKIEIQVCAEVTAEIDSKTGTVKLKDQLKWFQTFGADELVINNHPSPSEKKPSKTLKITDKEYIRSLQVSINQLRKSGDIMVDMGENAAMLQLEFIAGGKKEVIEFYDGRVKTPATSFFDSSYKDDRAIWQEIQNILGTSSATAPEFGKPRPFFVGHEIDFGDFKLKHLGSEDRTPKGTTASYYVSSFQVIPSGKAGGAEKEQVVEVSSGQLPPQPEEFKVGKKMYTLYTFSHDKVRLPARHLVIDKK